MNKRNAAKWLVATAAFLLASAANVTQAGWDGTTGFFSPVLNATNGGTGNSSYTTNAFVYFDGTKFTTSSSYNTSNYGGSSSAFSSITSGTNTTAAMVVGSGASLGVSGSGTIAATAAPLLGITGLGTGVATALGVNVGSSGAFITYDGALGTPSSGTLTNASGLPLSTGVIGTLQATNFPALTGDVSTSSGSLTTTLATVNTDTGSFGSSTAIPNFTVNGKGLITAAGTSAVVAPAGTLTGSTLASGVTGSSLTSVGTLTSGAIGSGFTAIPNSALANSTISGISLGSNLDTLTFGTHLTSGGSSYNGSAGVTISTDATNADTASTIVARDSSGNFSAGTVTASLTGHASLDCELSGCTMSGNLAMGSNNITGTGTVSATTLTGTLSTASQPNITGVGTITSGVWNGTTIAVSNGGTGTTTSTGSGNVVLSSSPTLTSPNLGTPSAAVLTNATGLPIGGITGLGTGVATALGVNVGSSGAFITYDGALGTPSSGTLTNASGLPIGGVTGWGTGVAAALADATNGSGGLITYGPGTNYAPATSGSSILYGNGAGGFSNATVGSGLSFSGGVLSSSGSGLFAPLVVDSPSSSGFQGVQFTSNAGFAEVNSYHNGTSYGPIVLYVGCQDTSADYTAIYDAYQEIAPTGGRIQLAAGNCDIPSGDSISPFSSDTTLVGAGYNGAGTFIRFAGSDTTSAFLIGAHSSADGTDCQQADNVAATFTGAISGTTLTATGITGGVILPGLTISGTGVTGSPTVTALLGGNQFTISVSQTVGSESMNATGCTQMVATEVGDLGMAAGSKTGGYAFDVNGASQVKIHDIYDAAPGSWDVLYGQYFNTLQFRNIAAYAQDTSSLGKLIYLYQPCVNSGGNCTNGNSRSDLIDIENVTINGQDKGYNVGLWVDGWINTVRAYNFAILDVGFGVVTENTQSLNRTYTPNSFYMRDLEVDHPGVGCSASLPGNGVYFGAGWALYILASDINDAGGNSTCSGSFPLVVDPGADTVTVADTGLHDTNYGIAFINGTNVTLSGIRGYGMCDATTSCDGITLTANSTNTLISDTTIGNWEVTGGSTFRNGVSISPGAGMVSLANNNYLGASNASVYNDSSNTISMVGGISGAGAAITGTTCAGGGTLC